MDPLVSGMSVVRCARCWVSVKGRPLRFFAIDRTLTDS